MRKVLLTVCACLFAVIGIDAQEVMKVHKADGTSVEINVSEIQKITFSTVSNPGETDTKHEYVDLGLPSGTKWATCNVGADSPEGYGDYFAWGETSPKSTYTEDNYKLKGLSLDDLRSKGVIDNNNQITSAYDAATVNWGGDWRMPNNAEINELIEKCSWKWTSQNGVRGYEVKGANGNKIFLPAAGSKYQESVNWASQLNEYWSSSASISNYLFSCYILYADYSDDGVECFAWTEPEEGLTIRPVLNKANNEISVTTGSASNITENSVNLAGTISGANTSQTVGIIYSSTYSTPTNGYGTKKSTTSSGSYSVTLSGLSPSTKYYYRAYAYIDGKYIYGEVKTFTTADKKETVKVITNEAELYASGEAVKLSGKVEGVSTEVTCGIIYDFSSNISESNGYNESSTSSSTFYIRLFGTALAAASKYYFRAYAVVDGEYIYGEIKSFTTNNPITVGTMIDLGLSVRWASYNLGASTTSPSEYGKYYTINEANSAANSFATNSRLPTKTEFQELIDKCTWNFLNYKGVMGNKVTGPNGNCIFLPFGGVYLNTDEFGWEYEGQGKYCMYWSSNYHYAQTYPPSYYYDVLRITNGYGTHMVDGWTHLFRCFARAVSN